jgi:hypothetical protein
MEQKRQPRKKSHIYSQWIVEKDAKNIQWGKFKDIVLCNILWEYKWEAP